ncbi:putative signal transduction protein containing EAL and modified HD-GYP domains [Vibrio nigripulchritudo SOn1]|uniref:Signal transduction protein containing EAL and modified HD-GYP domains n=1 Tax=Vibrio nigripulchritudo SOn1 TaxID=1238450 RepID=A0AAV2VUQ3_9VIBR|nr:HDOD domain-containing protein [Vibrio nigripulchritudo]CCO48345.1 putative signal transduction protein containing EAL and modified HD-GYP domains [Vibrio nigripulchritudo SOn1]
MKYSYVARQPIFDSDRQTMGYELLFRDGPKNTFPDVEPELATKRLLSDQFLSPNQNNLGTKKGFVNFPYQSLINQIPALFPRSSIIIEVLEDCEPTDELYDALKDLYRLGYKIALDDFIPNPDWKRFLPLISIIKFDIRTVPIGKASFFIAKLKSTKIQFLAEKVETYEEFQQAKEVGFTLFQGYFFAKPEMIQHRAIEPSLLNVIQLCKEISNDELNYDVIERLVSSDVSLSYKLLRYVNSTSSVANEIKSFKQALVYLGEDKLRKFVSLVAVSNANEGKPNSLYTLSITRARFCELVADLYKGQVDKSLAFLTGMLSLLDSLLDQPMEDILHSIPVDPSVKEALLNQTGVLGNIITLVKAFEQADWETTIAKRTELKLEENCIAECYRGAINWSQELMEVD